MKCSYCGCLESRVLDSRPAEEGASIRRRRECMQCGKRFTTYEKVEDVPMLVLKKDGHREPFDAQKIRLSVLKATNSKSSNVSIKDIDALVADVEKRVYNTLDQEISSSAIGEMVMDRLKALDEAAYVRFASVYRQFKDVDSFMRELAKLMIEKS